MPLPLIPLLAIGAVGLFGVGKTAKAVSDNSEARSINADVDSIVARAKKSINKNREASNASLEALGRRKVYTLNNSIPEFLTAIKDVKNLDELFNTSGNLDGFKNIKLDKQYLSELRQMSHFASSMIGGTAAGGVAGALTAFGAYSGAMAFGAASTGTAIATLSGAAATNATLAFLGGGSLAAGGLGMAGGAMVLGGLVAAPALAVLGLFAGSKASANLDNAYSNLAEARKFAEEMKAAGTMCNGIRRQAYTFERLLVRLDSMLLFKLLPKMKKVIRKNGRDCINMPRSAKKIVAETLSLANTIHTIINVSLLTEDGSLNKQSLEVAKEAQKAIPASLA